MITTKNYKGISVTFNTEDMNKKYVIYKLTFPNNKVYIGQTKQLLQTRISSHCYNSMSEKSPDYSTHKSRAIRKYQSFTVEVLGNCDNTLELDNLEIQMINIFDSVENGYNIQKGGSNSFDDLTLKEFEIFKNVVTEYHNNISLEARKLIRLNKPYTSYYIEYLNQINTDFNLEDFFKSNIFVIKKKPSNIINKKSTSYSDLVKYFRENNIEGRINWGNFSDKTEWTTLIQQSYKLYKNTWLDFTYANKMVDNYGDEYEVVKTRISRLFRCNETYTRKEVTVKLQKLYNEINLDRKAVYSDVKEVFATQDKVVRGERMIVILNKK